MILSCLGPRELSPAYHEILDWIGYPYTTIGIDIVVMNGSSIFSLVDGACLSFNDAEVSYYKSFKDIPTSPFKIFFIGEPGSLQSLKSMLLDWQGTPDLCIKAM